MIWWHKCEYKSTISVIIIFVIAQGVMCPCARQWFNPITIILKLASISHQLNKHSTDNYSNDPNLNFQKFQIFIYSYIFYVILTIWKKL